MVHRPEVAGRLRIGGPRGWSVAATVLGMVAGMVVPAVFGAGPVGASAVGARPLPTPAAVLARAAWPVPDGSAPSSGRTPSGEPRPHAVTASCTFNGQSTLVPNVSPGSTVAIACTGWAPGDTVYAAEVSPLFFSSGSANDVDPNVATFTANGAGQLDGTFSVPDPFAAPDPAAVCPPTASQVAQGYLRCSLVLGDASGTNLALVALNYAPAPVAVGIASTPDGGGYWVAWSNGAVTPHGDAQDYGNASGLNLVAPISHIVGTTDGRGYWLVAADGGTFAFGDAGFYGSMGGMALNAPVVDLAPTRDGKGYWLVASDGGIFAFGDAVFHGSMGGRPLNQPVVGIAADLATGGYWLVASDGGIFAIDAPFFGSTGSIRLNRPVNGMAATATSGGYWFVASDGGIFAFGDAAFHGSLGNLTLNKPIVGMSADLATGGYWLVGGDGGVFAVDAPFFGAG